MNLEFLRWALDGLVLIALWFVRSVYVDFKEKNKELEVNLKETSKEITEIKLHYLGKEEFKEFKKSIDERFDRLYDSLDEFKKDFKEHEIKEIEMHQKILEVLSKK